MTARWGVAAGAIAAAAMLGLASCGDDDNGTTAAAPPQVDADPLRIEIQSAVVPDFAGTAAPTVRFRVVDGSGTPVNLEAEMATTTRIPRTTGPRFTLSMLEDTGDYVSYYATTTAPRAYTYEPDADLLHGTTFTRPTPTPRLQATSPAAPASSIKPVAGSPGVYEYTFPAPTVRTGLDRSKTHTVGAWISRRVGAATTDTDAAGGSFNFVPAGGTPQKDEVVSDAACNKCHGFVQAHGSRRTTQLCITCHSPQTGDPETDRTVDFKVMIHKIHSGETLKSVQQGKPYYIVGNAQTVHDWSDLAFPWHDHGVQHCTVCHSGGEDSGNWRTKPTLTTCTSCHDNVQFTSAAGLDPCPAGTAAPANFKDCVHRGGPITVSNPNDVTSCQGCHGAGAANAIDKYHHGDDAGAAAPAPTPVTTTTPAPGPTPVTTTTPGPTTTATFSGVVQPILTSKCGSCHGTSFGSSTRATAYTAAQSRVNVTTPDSSLLIQKGDARVAHGGGDQLDPAQVTSITAWIREGAQNN
jgi:OmcA/MtrC family decaheme c-type cytochrome